jgi:hypothetical protein
MYRVPFFCSLPRIFLITVVLDVSPIYLRIGSLIIPLPFGFSLLWFSHHGTRWAVVDGTVVAILGVAGMLTIVAYTDNVPILPESACDWRETGNMPSASRSP